MYEYNTCQIKHTEIEIYSHVYSYIQTRSGRGFLRSYFDHLHLYSDCSKVTCPGRYFARWCFSRISCAARCTGVSGTTNTASSDFFRSKAGFVQCAGGPRQILSLIIHRLLKYKNLHKVSDSTLSAQHPVGRLLCASRGYVELLSHVSQQGLARRTKSLSI